MLKKASYLLSLILALVLTTSCDLKVSFKDLRSSSNRVDDPVFPGVEWINQSNGSKVGVQQNYMADVIEVPIPNSSAKARIEVTINPN